MTTAERDRTTIEEHDRTTIEEHDRTTIEEHDRTPTEIVVTGATGRMGQAVIDAASERDDVRVALAVSESAAGELPTASGPQTITPAEDLPELLDEHQLDALVDFTVPMASETYVTAAADAGVPAVIGTTGFDDEGMAVLRNATDTIPVLHAPNFAPGVEALLASVEAAIERLPGYDIEVTETHHSGKRDAPSGTALRIVERIEATVDRDEPATESSRRVYGREGKAPREDGEIGIHARRAGGIRGEHEILVASGDEELRLTHRMRSREPFASGALDAAVWLAGRDRGWYGFADVRTDQ